MWICSTDSVSIQRDILNFLREGELPHRDRVRAVHREAQYYAIGPLLDSLEDTQPLTGEKVRQAFLDLLPYYKGTWSLSLSQAEIEIRSHSGPPERLTYSTHFRKKYEW